MENAGLVPPVLVGLVREDGNGLNCPTWSQLPQAVLIFRFSCMEIIQPPQVTAKVDPLSARRLGLLRLVPNRILMKSPLSLMT